MEVVRFAMFLVMLFVVVAAIMFLVTGFGAIAGERQRRRRREASECRSDP